MNSIDVWRNSYSEAMAENQSLKAELETLKAHTLCNVCLGEGDPGTGKPCICGGSGLAHHAQSNLTIDVVKLDAELQAANIAHEALKESTRAALRCSVPKAEFDGLKQAHEQYREWAAGQMEGVKAALDEAVGSLEYYAELMSLNGTANENNSARLALATIKEIMDRK